MPTEEELLEAIIGILDCPSHFQNISILNKDGYFSLGDYPQVMCSSCVDRLRELVDRSGYRHYPWVNSPPEIKEGK